MESLKVGLCGLGTVGSSVVNIFNSHSKQLAERAGTSVELSHVGARRLNPLCDLGDIKHSTDIFAVVNDPDIDLVIEVIGGTTVAKDLVVAAINAGKHVVTANKALIAEFGAEIFALAKAAGVSLRFEAAVAGAIPIIKTLTEGLSANSVSSISGIINGTTNFILSKMSSEGGAFVDVLKEAQALGYAEADPTFDVEGIDAAHKLQIMATLAFSKSFEFGSVSTIGITQIEKQDIDEASGLGYKIKHLGIAKNKGDSVELRVQPTLVPKTHPIANIDGALNAVHVEADSAGGILSVGAGAGGAPTASAVVADVIDLARNTAATSIPNHLESTARVTAPGNCESAYYLRFRALDCPGVMSRIARVLSDHDISIEVLNQRERDVDSDKVSVVIITNTVMQQQFDNARTQLEQLDDVVGEVKFLHVESSL